MIEVKNVFPCYVLNLVQHRNRFLSNIMKQSATLSVVFLIFHMGWKTIYLNVASAQCLIVQYNTHYGMI